MQYTIKDEKYRFMSAFDTQTGAYIRTGIIDENGFIEKVMPKVKPDTNAAEILAYLKGE